MSRLPPLSRTPGSGVIRGALFWAAEAALLLLSCAPSPPPSIPIVLGEWKELEIRRGDSQHYSVQLAAGQLVRAIVDQGDADVDVSLVGPDGKDIWKVDSVERTIWDEELIAVAQRTGLHQIVVHLPGENGTRRYRIRIDAPRQPTERDHRRIQALRLSYQAVELSAHDRAGKSRPQQVEIRQRALRLWRLLGDRPRESEMLYQLGLLQKHLGDIRKSSHLLHQALPGLSDPAQRAQVLGETGMVDWGLEQVQHAQDHFQEALRLARQAGDVRLQVDDLNNFGRFHTTALGHPRDALPLLQEARQRSREIGYREGEASALINLGSAYHDLSDDPTALTLYKDALDIALQLSKSEKRAEILGAAYNNLGQTYDALGDRERAAEHLGKALELSGTSGDSTSEATTLQNLAVVLEKDGNVRGALHNYDEALATARRLGIKDLQAAILTNRGYLYLAPDQDARKALLSCQEALPLAEGRETKARALHILGAAQRQLGDLPAARKSLRQALALSQENLALEADITMVLAKVEHDAGQLENAAELAGQAIQKIEDLRERVVRQDLRELFLASKQGFYEFYVDVLMELERRRPGKGYAAQALEMNERARARGLLDLLSEVGADLSRDASPALLQREKRLRADIGALYQHRLNLLRDGAAAQRLAEAASRLDATIEELHQATADLKKSSPHYAALTRPEPLSAGDIQKKALDPGSLLLEFALGEDRSWLWAVSRDSITTFELPPRSEIEKQALLLNEAITARSGKPPQRLEEADRELLRSSAALSRMLLGQVEPLLKGRRLLVVSDGALHYIPIEALPLPSTLTPGGSGPSLLVRHNESVSLPSASTLAVLREEETRRQPTAKVLAAFGDPVFQAKDVQLSRSNRVRTTLAQAATSQNRGLTDRNGDPSQLSRLRYSRYEVEEIVKLAGPERSLKALGAAASREAVMKGDLAAFRYVHFATHGAIDAEKPELSALVFSRFDAGGRPLPEGEELLRLPDIYNLRLNADLVTLSACETALGKEVSGEGLIGLTRGFMYAGSARVLASLWKVDDQQTARLMLRFYKALLVEHRTAPAALRVAQREALDKGLHPYYWAGFSLQGEPR